MELSALAVRVVYAEPLCFAVAALQGRAETLLLHLEWQQRQCETTTRNNSIGGGLKPGPEAQHAPASSSSSWAGHDKASHQGAQQLQGVLFDGLRCVAQYSWPLPLSQQEGGVLTAAVQLPHMVYPCVLELVLYADAANTATTGAAAAAAAALPSSAAGIADDRDSSSSSSSSRSVLSSGVQSLPARCPVVYLPPAAVQEVQQLLLPAMQQEVLEGWAGSQAGARTAGAAAAEPPGGMPLPLLQAAVWQHWQALADDLGLVLGLQQQTCAQDDETAAALDVSESRLPAETAAQGPQAAKPPQQRSQELGHLLVRQRILPHMLEFLTSQGLQHVAAVVQHAARDTAVHTPATAAAAAAAAAAAEPSGRQHAVGSQPLPKQSASSPTSAVGSREACGISSVCVKGGASDQDSSHGSSSAQVLPPPGMHTQGVCASSSSSSGTRPSSQQQEVVEQGLHAGTAPQQTASSAATCWTGFPSRLEEQYVAYKHQQYLWLDRYAAWYALLRFCVLLVRMVREGDLQGSLLYLCHVVSKGMPYLLLLQRHTLEQYQRQREVLLAVVSPALCLAPIVVGALLVDPTITLPLIQGTSWAITWCQQHASRLLQAWVLLQARWPQLGVVGRLPGAEQLAAAATAAAVALDSLPDTAVHLHEHMKTVIVVPESPLRSFWRVYGEYLVLLPMAIPRHVRLWYFIPSTLAEVAGNCYVFSWVFPWWQVVLRFTPALLLTIGVAWWFDWYVRGKFVGHLQQLEQQRVQQLAAKLKGLGEDG